MSERLTPILKRLVQAREQAGLSQGQVAKLMQMDSAATVSHYERGLRGLSLEKFLELCEIYAVSPTWALTGFNPEFDPTPFMEIAERTHIAKRDIDTIVDLLTAATQPTRADADAQGEVSGE